MSRKWPIPLKGNTLHCVGDVHMGRISAARQAILAADMDHPRMPDLPHHLQLGDMTHASTPAEWTAAKAMMDQMGGDWWAVVGNHDMYDPVLETAGTPRTADAAAADMGMPAASYTVDLGYAVLIALGPVSMEAWTRLAYDSTWLDAQLQANADRPCLIAAHPPLYETVGARDPSNQFRSIDWGFFADTDADLRAVIADNPNAKAWLSGHTHSPITSSDLVKREVIGGHAVAMINSSSIYYQGTAGVQALSTICTVFVTVDDDKIEVRFRDHGSHTWVGGSHDRRTVQTVLL